MPDETAPDETSSTRWPCGVQLADLGHQPGHRSQPERAPLVGERAGADLDDDRLALNALACHRARPYWNSNVVAFDVHIVARLGPLRPQRSIHPQPVETLAKIPNSFFVVEVEPAYQAPHRLALAPRNRPRRAPPRSSAPGGARGR